MKYRGTTGANGCEYPYSSLQSLRCGPPPHLAHLGFPSFAVTDSRDSPRWIDAHSRSTRLNRLNATTVLTVVLVVRTTTTTTPNVRARGSPFLDHGSALLEAVAAFVEISCRRKFLHKTNDNTGHSTNHVTPAR